MSFTIAKKQEGTKLVVALSGAVDEDAVFSALEVGSSSDVSFDLDKVTAINSVGIREWIKWLKEIPSTVKITVSKCPKVIVDQINMVSGFLPPGTVVESFYVPYYSEESGSEKMVLFVNGKEYKDGQINLPSEVKDDSGEVMEMDIIEAKYFKFLKS